MDVRSVPIRKINPAPYNPRLDLKPEDAQYQKLLRSIDEFGCVEPLVWNRRTGHLVGGHQRFKVLLAQGAQAVDVSVVDLSLEKEKALNLALNKIQGGWDDAKLAALLHELVQVPDLDLELTGFDLPEVEDLLRGLLEPDVAGDGFDVGSELDSGGPTVTRRGELLELGPHRLLCGDSTDAKELGRLFEKDRARLCLTDPPYGVDYDPFRRPTTKSCRSPRSRTTAEGTRSGKLRNDDLSPKQYATWFERLAVTLAEVLEPGIPLYVWQSHRQLAICQELLTRHGFVISSLLVWAKESFCLGFGDYNEQAEYCIYGWRKGARHRWYGPKNESTIWRIHRDRTDRYAHPTQKPLELAERGIRNSSRAGEVVFDPFLGSGTTLIAAARLGRRCFGVEIEPRYCDCVVRRYIAAAGPKAIAPHLAQRYLRKEAV